MAPRPDRGALAGRRRGTDVWALPQRRCHWPALPSDALHPPALVRGRPPFRCRTLLDPEPLFWDEDPLYDTDPLFDVVDVFLPLYLAATAISSGAYDRLLHLRGGNKRRRYGWRLELEERIAFPTPRGGPSPVGFPGGYRPGSLPPARVPSRRWPGSGDGTWPAKPSS